LRWGVLAFVWTCAIVGIVLKTIYVVATPDGLGLGLYLGVGWLGVASGLVLGWRHGWSTIAPLMQGGMAYTAGGIASIVVTRSLLPGYVGPHELFHVAVLFALASHWRLMRDLERIRGLRRVALAPRVVAGPRRRVGPTTAPAPAAGWPVE
jgi:channel protein (hemolysin III family)